MSDERTISVLYLAGSGRSGSTLLSRLLELQQGYRSVGETRYVADAETWPVTCGCGRPHSECPLWGPLIDRWSDPQRLAAWSAANRAGQKDQLRGFISPNKPSPQLERAIAEVHEVFRKLSADGQIVVDESKTPWLGYLIANQPWADVRFVELVRDPREVIGSWQQEKDYLAASPRETMAKHWLRTCLTAEVVRKRTGLPWLRTSYNRLAADPIGVLSDIISGPVAGLQPADGVVTFENAAANHIYLSNPDKTRRGPDSVRPPAQKRLIPAGKVGPCERAATQYWKRYLAARTERNDGFIAFPAPEPGPADGARSG